MTNLILLLTSVVSLLQGVNSPDVSVSLKLQALDASYNAIAIAQEISNPVSTGNGTLGAIEIGIENTLKTVQASQRASIKGFELAKIKSNPRTNIKFSGADIDIEIVDTKAIENGVEVYARAWDMNGQIGFGQDGSVDIERFIFINPPVLVDDINGDIIRTWTDKNTSELKTRKLRENPKLAILQSLTHTISVKKEKFNSDKIIAGKIGHTTLTVYPDADPETTSVDGRVYRAVATPESFATIRGSAGTAVSDNASTEVFAQIDGRDSTTLWSTMSRGPVLFDTFSLPDNAVISAATLSIYGSSKSDFFAQSINIVKTTPASNTALVMTDYNIANWDMTQQSDNPITITAWSDTAYNNFAFNATGIGNVSKIDISKFGIAISADYNNLDPGTHTLNEAYIIANAADQAGTAQDPKLVVEYTVPVSITPQIIWFD